MKIKTSELTGAALDWAVARLESSASPTGMDGADILLYRSKATNAWMYKRWAIPYSTDWAQGGPIMEREEIGATVVSAGGDEKWLGANYRGTFVEYGTTCLEACMRCYVASKLGDEVDIPEELK